MVVCLCIYLYKVEMLYKVGGFVNCKDGYDLLFIFKCLMEYLREVEYFIKLYLFVN